CVPFGSCPEAPARSASQSGLCRNRHDHPLDRHDYSFRRRPLGRAARAKSVHRQPSKRGQPQPPFFSRSMPLTFIPPWGTGCARFRRTVGNSGECKRFLRCPYYAKERVTIGCLRTCRVRHGAASHSISAIIGKKSAKSTVRLGCYSLLCNAPQAPQTRAPQTQSRTFPAPARTRPAYPEQQASVVSSISFWTFCPRRKF